MPRMKKIIQLRDQGALQQEKYSSVHHLTDYLASFGQPYSRLNAADIENFLAIPVLVKPRHRIIMRHSSLR